MWSLTDIADHTQLSSPATQLTIITFIKSTPFLDWTHPELVKISLKSTWQQQSTKGSLFSNSVDRTV